MSSVEPAYGVEEAGDVGCGADVQLCGSGSTSAHCDLVGLVSFLRQLRVVPLGASDFILVVGQLGFVMVLEVHPSVRVLIIVALQDLELVVRQEVRSRAARASQWYAAAVAGSAAAFRTGRVDGVRSEGVRAVAASTSVRPGHTHHRLPGLRVVEVDS